SRFYGPATAWLSTPSLHDALPILVTVVEARRMTVPLMAEPIGTTRALQEVSVRARVRGFLKEIHFEEGADVKKDQLLFLIDEERSEEHTSELQSRGHLVCRLLLEK